MLALSYRKFGILRTSERRLLCCCFLPLLSFLEKEQ